MKFCLIILFYRSNLIISLNPAWSVTHHLMASSERTPPPKFACCPCLAVSAARAPGRVFSQAKWVFRAGLVSLGCPLVLVSTSRHSHTLKRILRKCPPARRQELRSSPASPALIIHSHSEPDFEDNAGGWSSSGSRSSSRTWAAHNTNCPTVVLERAPPLGRDQSAVWDTGGCLPGPAS